MIQLTKDTFQEEVLNHKGDVVVEFYKPVGCGNCEQMKPIMEEFEKNNPNVKVCLYECSGTPDEISSTYQFKMFPGIFSFKDGKPVRGFSGSKTLKQLSMIFLLPHELKMLYADAQIHADQIKNEILNYNQGTQVVFKKEEKVNEPTILPEITDPSESVQCDSCQ